LRPATGFCCRSTILKRCSAENLGDVHACQGDTEFTGTAAETNATVRLRLEVIPGKKSGWMRIEKPESIVDRGGERQPAWR
jgi:acetamidase/formamidase